MAEESEPEKSATFKNITEINQVTLPLSLIDPI